MRTVMKSCTALMVIVAAMACGDQSARTQQADGEFRQANTVNSPLRSAITDPRARSFYETRQWREAWTDGAEQDLVEAIEGATRHGLDPQRFNRLIRTGGDDMAREASLTQAALAYAQALAHGVVDPKEVHDVYTVPRNQVDISAGLSAALQAGNLGEWLESLAPSDRDYKALSEAYLRYSAEANKPEREIASGELIRPGKRDPRVPQIALALRQNGYSVAAAPEATERDAAPAADAAVSQPSALYTKEMAAAVKQLQADYGLKADGIIGNDTLKLLNTGPADRARQLAVNLERRRWLQRTPFATRVDVNTAAAYLTYFYQGRRAWQTRVIVGEPDWQTPALGTPLHQLVANPAWHVPKEIAEKEILPKGEAYMQKENMYFKDDIIVQRPGPDSALGLVKFDLKNNQAIYLHDTPSKKLFAEAERHLSHGCVRVENPLEFARLLADTYGKRDVFERALESGETKYIPLGVEIPVRMLYHTAYLDQSGQVAFRPDVYGRDDALAEKMGLMPGMERRYEMISYDDVGP